MVFQTGACQDFITNSALRGHLRSSLSWTVRTRDLGSRPRWTVQEKIPVWGCVLSRYLHCSAKTCIFSLSMVKRSLSVKRLSESTKAAPENRLCGQFVHTDRFILSTLVLSGSWEKFLPKCTLTCTSVCGIRKWCFFFGVIGTVSVNMYSV